MSTSPTPSADEKSEFLLSCRYGELDDVRQFVDTYGVRTALLDVHDDNDNTPLHMVAANGHDDVLAFLLSSIPSEPNSIPSPSAGDQHSPPNSPTALPTQSLAHQILRAQNTSGSTPLHWAALNAQLPIVQTLVAFRPSPPTSPHTHTTDSAPVGLGADLLDVKNAAGLTPLGEAERAGWADGARWIVGVMNLHPASSSTPADDGVGGGGGGKEAEGEDGEDAEGGEDGEDVEAIEVEIEDADGGIAKMSLSAKDLHQSETPPPPHTSTGSPTPLGAAS